MKKFLGTMLALLMVLSTIATSGLLISFAEEDGNVASAKEELSQKSEAQQYIYKQIVSDPLNYDENGWYSIDVSEYNISKADCFAFLENILREEGDLFYLDQYGYSGYPSESSISYARFHCTYAYSSKAQLEADITEYNAYMNDLCALANDGWTDLEIALFYHDYLAANFEYDTTYTNYDAFSFLKEGKGVCQAYTLTYEAIMNRLGIPCSYVESNNFNHIWNAVYLNDKWYAVDITHDDPTYDNPGKVLHKNYLVSLETYFSQDASHSVARTDYKLGSMIGGAAISEDHPLHNFYNKSNCAFAWTMENFYTILSNGANGYALCRVDVNTGTVLQELETLSNRWTIPNSTSYYSGNYSRLCGYQGYLYYYDDMHVYIYDVKTGRSESIYECRKDTRIYGLQIRDGKIVAYFGTTPNEKKFTAYQLNIIPPVYYTITWVIGNDSVRSYVAKGETPIFDGSPELEDENGIAYIFTGWTPEVVPATKDTEYVAQFEKIPMYMEGDMNGNGVVDISDVTTLLNYLADHTNPIDLSAADMNRDGNIDIADVSSLLNLLAVLK